MLDLHRLTLLRELKIRGSMTAAARALQYSHSAISQQLALLERETGVVLLERVGRGVRLTEAGEELVRNTEAILTAMEHAESALAGTHPRAQGRVTLAAFGTISRSVMPAALAALAHDFPDLDVRLRLIDPDEAPNQLVARQVDAVLVDAYPGQAAIPVPGVHATLLGVDPVRGYLPATVADDDPDALRSVRWVLESRGSGSAEWAVRVLRELGVEPIVAYESSDLLFHVRLVEHGLAAAFLPDMLVREAQSTLRPSRLLPTDRTRRIEFLVRSGAESSPALAAVRDAVAARLGA